MIKIIFAVEPMYYLKLCPNCMLCFPVAFDYNEAITSGKKKYHLK